MVVRRQGCKSAYTVLDSTPPVTHTGSIKQLKKTVLFQSDLCWFLIHLSGRIWIKSQIVMLLQDGNRIRRYWQLQQACSIRGRGLIPHSFSQQTFLLTIHKLDKDRVAQPQPPTPICQEAWKKLYACTTRQPEINGISNRYLLIILFEKRTDIA